MNWRIEGAEATEAEFAAALDAREREGPKWTLAVDECGDARISQVTALYDLPDVKVFEIATADRAPLARRCWGIDFGDRIYIAASEEEVDRGDPLTSVTFGGLSTDWQVYIEPDKYEVKVFLVRIPGEGAEGLVLWTAKGANVDAER